MTFRPRQLLTPPLGLLRQPPIPLRRRSPRRRSSGSAARESCPCHFPRLAAGRCVAGCRYPAGRDNAPDPCPKSGAPPPPRFPSRATRPSAQARNDYARGRSSPLKRRTVKNAVEHSERRVWFASIFAAIAFGRSLIVCRRTLGQLCVSGCFDASRRSSSRIVGWLHESVEHPPNGLTHPTVHSCKPLVSRRGRAWMRRLKWLRQLNCRLGGTSNGASRSQRSVIRWCPSNPLTISPCGQFDGPLLHLV